MKCKKKKENGLLPTLAFFSHSNKTLLLLSSAIALDGICVSIAVDALMTNSVEWQRKNEIMVALTVHQILHILCTRAQVHRTPPSKAIFFLAPRDIINQKPLYADMNDGAEKNEGTKISCFISYFLRASLLQMHEWSAQAHCKPLLHAPRIRVWNCFFSIRRSTQAQHAHMFVSRRTFWSHCFPLNLRWSNEKSSTPWLPVSLLCCCCCRRRCRRYRCQVKN